MVKERCPKTVELALQLLAAEDLIPYAGGTDLMVRPGKNTDYLFISKIDSLKQIYAKDGDIHFGACCTFTEALESALVPDYFKICLYDVAAPAIRNMGTIGGNIANGSAKADSVPTLFAVDATLKLESAGGKREVPIRAFATGQITLEKGELITEIVIPKKAPDVFICEKVGEREALAISRVSFAGAMSVSGGVITQFSTAYGAISKKMLSWPELDFAFVGKTIKQASEHKAGYLSAVEDAIRPIDGRVSAGYRKFTCINLLNGFLDKCGF